MLFNVVGFFFFCVCVCALLPSYVLYRCCWCFYSLGSSPKHSSFSKSPSWWGIYFPLCVCPFQSCLLTFSQQCCALFCMDSSKFIILVPSEVCKCKLFLWILMSFLYLPSLVWQHIAPPILPSSLPLLNAIDFINMPFMICWIILFPLHFNHLDDNICWQQYTDVFQGIL